MGSQPSYIPYKLLASMAPPFLLPLKMGGIVALEYFLMSYHFSINVARREEGGGRKEEGKKGGGKKT
jgi:hypothetical protein